MPKSALWCLVALAVLPLAGSGPSQDEISALHWRLIGPNRSGRVWAVAGVPGDSATYYIGTPAGALWKTSSAGTTWRAVSDALPVTGIGAIAVAPSDAHVVYVGTGSNTLGAGVFRSADAGATWQAAGLPDSKYITSLIVDPRDRNVVIAGAGSGGNFGSMVLYNNNPSPARGVYRTGDGGRTWTHVLFVNENTSVVDLAMDPTAPDVIFASMAAAAARQASDGGSGIYRSQDGGKTWQRTRGAGLPASAVSVNIAVAPHSGARRLYALAGGRGGGGLFRSDDGGETWTLGTARLASAGGHLYVDPNNPDIVYTMGTSVYRSTDGGRTLEAIKGAPGGDDPHAMWIDPENPRRMIVGADQGPTISVDGGTTWTPWYAVPNGEFYYISTDNAFPYRVYSAQQDSGTVSILSRSDYGAIRPTDWFSVSGYEEGHIFADPLNPRDVYTHGNNHAVIRFDRVTGQAGPVYTASADDRFGPRPGMELSPKDPHWMFVGAQYVLASDDRTTWTKISPDLTARADQSIGGGRPGRGTIVALAPSPLDLDLLWAGTSNGLIHVTRDRGRTWTNVSPPRLTSEPALTIWSLEASAHDAGVAYAGIIDLSDRHGPCLMMTSDFGAHWHSIDAGLPADVPTRVVREDPEDANLLYAGTQAGIFVSFDRGAHWTSLQLDLPRVGVNDIAVHETDLVIATWGRGLWILDDVSPLRQWAEFQADTAPAHLFAPRTATRVRWDVNQDTPLPPEVLTGENAPDGAIIDYALRQAGGVTITIRDAAGAIVRQFTSVVPGQDTRMPNVPEYWFAKPQVTDATVGMHRLVWDLRYATPPALDYDREGNPLTTVSYGIIAPAIIGRSPRQQPLGPLVLPGTYSVSLSAGRQTVRRDLRVVNDPRSPATASDLEAQLQSQRGLAAGIERSFEAIKQLRALRAQADARGRSKSDPEVGRAVAAFDATALKAITALAGGRDLAEQLAALEFADLRPTPSTLAAIQDTCTRADRALDAYRQLLQGDLGRLNVALRAADLEPLTAPSTVLGQACEMPR